MKIRMLSPSETACISWISRGKSIAEIAALEGRTIEEIKGYLERARIALGAMTLSDAVERACRIDQICGGG
jgi:DNA-binding CsgD family transcriptional regulator